LLYYKTILSLSVIATISISTSSLAFQGNNQSQNVAKHMIPAKNEQLEIGAHKFVSDLTTKGLGILSNENLSGEKRNKEFKDLLQSSFDMKSIARFALGRYWRTSTKSEQNEYLKLFENMIVEVYSKRFSNYKGQQIELISTIPTGKADIMVSSVLIPETGAKIDIDWRVRKKKDGQLKIIDIMVEGVSMAMTQRSDFSSVIQRGGGKIEVLLAHLRPED